MKKIMVFGACSAIAQETIKCFAREDADLFLIDLSLHRLEAVRDDVIARTGSKSKFFLDTMNALDFAQHESLINKVIKQMNGLDAVLIAHGTLPDQQKAQLSAELTLREFAINCTSVISLITIIANYFEQKGEGTIAVISSVAGDRGRQSNYIYGAAKGGVTRFLQGLRNRLSTKGIKVITIKPGLVDTPMTAGVKKNPLFSSAEVVGKGIYKSMRSGKDVVYLPSYWRLIMWVVIHIPEGIFKKMKF